MENITRTSNITEFDNELKKLNTHKHGIGCAEPSLQAIRKGLEEGLHQSLLLVFTDASPRDTELLPNILTLIANKLIKVRKNLVYPL